MEAGWKLCFLALSFFVTYMYNLHFHASAYMFETQTLVSCFVFFPSISSFIHNNTERERRFVLLFITSMWLKHLNHLSRFVYDPKRIVLLPSGLYNDILTTGFRSGLWLGHCRNFTACSQSSSCVFLLICFRSLFC